MVRLVEGRDSDMIKAPDHHVFNTVRQRRADAAMVDRRVRVASSPHMVLLGLFCFITDEQGVKEVVAVA